MADPSLARQVFPPGYLGDALFEAVKLPGEVGNVWGKLNAAASTTKDQVMMPMNALMQRAFPGQFQPPMQAQVTPQPLPPAQQPGPPPVLPNPDAGTFGMRQPQMGGPRPMPPVGMQPGGMIAPTITPMPGAPQSHLMPVGQTMPMGQQPPMPVNNIFTRRMARY